MVKAERRAEHNAIERARRESLNSRFQQLAHALPNLQNDRRPSKSTIIERTLDYVRFAQMKEERYRHQIFLLLKDNERMKRHLRKYRREQRQQQYHHHPYAPATATVADSGSVSSSGDEDPYLMTAVLGSNTVPPRHAQCHPSSSSMMMMMPTPPSSSITTAAAAATATVAATTPWEHAQYMTPLPTSPKWGSLSCCDDEDDSDSASLTQPTDVTSYHPPPAPHHGHDHHPYQQQHVHPVMAAATSTVSAGNGFGSTGDYMTEPIAEYHPYVKMEAALK
ncbi:hypothetical protein BX666DRAFT_511226 [Dichotomocladium elegans]|nr:hypothetical protein BX666DRAFT_511226 [Dichotomocladium elegans]